MSIASQVANFSNNIINTIAFIVEVVIFLLSDFVFSNYKTIGDYCRAAWKCEEI